MTDYSLATINTSNSLASRLVRAVGGGRLQDIVSGTALTSVGVVGNTSEGFTFSGASSIELPDTPLTQFTVFALAYAYSGANGTLVSRSAWGAEAYNQNYVLRLQSGLTPRGQFKEDGTSNFPTLNSGSSGSAGTLLTTAFSYDGTNQELYLNGTSVGTQAASAPWTSTSTAMVTQIGAVDGTERAAPYGGLGIQLVLIFNAALSDAEIASLHSNPNQVFNLGGAPADTTAPTLTSATATATSATTATGGVTTDEAGPAWAVLTTSSTTPSAAQIKAGQNHTGAAASASATATLVVGANPGVFAFTGLTGGGTYWEHVVQDDTASPANTSTPITSASSITTPTPDTTPPTMNGSITVGTKTSGSISISYPAASDNVAVTGYEVSTNGTTWSDNGTSLSYTFLGLSALTSYTLYVRAYDAAGNRAATPLTVTTSTYRAGDTAANILANTGPVGGNPAGFLYAFASTVSGTDWLSYTITSGPTPSGGTLDAQPDGRFTYTGPAPATMVIQPEVNGVNAAETITVTLYDAADITPPFLSDASSTATGANTATGQVSTNEANGTLYALISTDNGLIDVDDDGFWLAPSKQSQAVTATGVQNVSFSGLLPSTTYTVYFGQEDAALNRSGVARTLEITTSAAPDTELPVLTGSITVTSITSTGYNLSWPTGTDNTGVAGYEYSLNGGTSWTDNGNVTTKAITGRTPESTDQVQVRAYDAAGNKSTPPLSTSVTLLAGPDVTAPLLTDPTAYASGPTTASGTVTTNEATGTLYFLRNNSATATDVAVKAGLSQAVTAAGIQTVNVTGLTASTPGNYIHYLHRDGSGNDSLVSSSAAFATPAAPAPGLKVIGAQPNKLIARSITRPIAIKQTD